MKKQALIEALHRFIRQRPGLEFANYGDVSAYLSESRAITRDLHHARALLSAVAWRDGITADDIIDASCRAFSGRLTITPTNDGEGFSIDYCTGQYFPTEYRRAVASVLASALWAYWRDSLPTENERKGYEIRRTAMRELGRSLACQFFN